MPPRICPVPMAVLMLALAGCSQGERFPPACPALTMLPDAADLTQYSAAGQDITDMVVDARIIAIPAKCSPDSPGKVSASLKVNMAVQRGPAATSSSIPLPFFVAVMDGDRVLDKQDYTLTAKFPANINQALPSSDQIDMILPVTRDKSAAAYGIYVGFVLTPEELALNRKRGSR